MWMGEQITEFGIGNGISIILFAGILSRVPSYGQQHGHSYIVSDPTKLVGRRAGGRSASSL